MPASTGKANAVNVGASPVWADSQSTFTGNPGFLRLVLIANRKTRLARSKTLQKIASRFFVFLALSLGYSHALDC